MLRLENIVKDFGTKEQVTHVLKGISIQFRKSEFVSILGHSGCGKTTLLNLIGGLDSCTDGTVFLDGKSTKSYTDSDWNLYRNKKIGFVFQSYNLIHHLSIEKNVELPLQLSEVPKAERKRRALEALEKVGLRDHARKHPNQLSGGQMQRVAIARALVNNPSIIMADEPTGALDSESGVQVMDILKEVAKDKLVVMVTHNDALAEEYSTRIIRMNDGFIVDDTNPYSLEDCLNDEVVAENEKRAATEKLISENAKTEKDRKKFVRKLKQQEYEKRMKTSMSLGTAISMSLTNLRSKLGRTLLTSIAGSIGIIGIMLVLSLSTGVKSYISGIEQDALSQYPVTVNNTNMDLMGALNILSSANTAVRPDYPDKDEIYIQTIMGNVFKDDTFFKNNDLGSLKEYIEDNFDGSLGYVKYNYGVSMEIYRQCEGEDKDYACLYPFVESIKNVLPDGAKDFLDTIEQYSAAMNAWDELIDNKELLESQYELIGDSRWPTSYDEIILVADQKNQFPDYVLFLLGLVPPSKVGDFLNLGGLVGGDTSELFDKVYTIEELLDVRYKVMTGNDYYQKDDKGKWVEVADSERVKKDFVNANGVTLKVVGVVRPREGTTVTCINGCAAYSPKLVEYLSERAKTKEGSLGEAYYKNPGYDPRNGQQITTDSEKLSFTRMLGVCTFEEPTAINIYASSFENKNKIVEFLDGYNDYQEQQSNPKTVKYSDNLSMIMGYVDTLTETVTRVLVGFASISLIVSSIMISIIIYTSVLERRKEIGILRSVGARKLDISNVFISESALLGFTSGLLGIFITWLCTLLVNFVLKLLLGISDLAIINWWSPLLMLLISILLSFLAGFVPARIAANKDPVECLRTE